MKPAALFLSLALACLACGVSGQIGYRDPEKQRSDSGQPPIEHDAGETDAGVIDAGWAWGPLIPLSSLNTEAEEAHPTLTGDQLTICFHSTRDGGLGSDIWCAHRFSAEEAFEAPAPQVNVNSSNIDWMPALSRDGTELFFSSDRPGGSGKFDLYRAVWSDSAGTFGTPELVHELNTPEWESGPSLSPDGKSLFFESNRDGGLGHADIYVATRAGPGQPFGPALTVAGVNTPFGDGEPSIAADSSVLLSCAFRPDAGMPFLLEMTRLPSGAWSEARRPDIEGHPGAEGCGPEILSDGSLVFHVERDGGVGMSDLYVAPRR
jgi:hypothetical protein